MHVDGVVRLVQRFPHPVAGSAQQLKDLLSAVAVFAAGGRKALADFSKRKGGVVRLLTHQIS